ncbi:MAG: RluA family pseudouridine synthase [Roseburia sp.]|nr:RluA family pseudouridine synthase [Roseburia sp.]
MILFQISANEAGQRFDKYLKKLLKNAPDSFLYKMLRKKNITLNGEKADGREPLAVGDTVRLFLSDETFGKFSGNAQAADTADTVPYKQAYDALGSLHIVFENRDILVVDKPAGVLSQKAAPTDRSLNEWLIGYLLESGQITARELATFRPSVCNRLDRNTSGMVVCGKTLAGSQYMSALIRDKALEKYYYCLVDGAVTLNERITGRLHKDGAHNKVRIYRDLQETAAREDTDAIDTAFSTLRSNGRVTLLEARLFTGKPHQIRAQLAALGHPIIGDTKYGSRTIPALFYDIGVRYQLLHAHKLVFPETSEDRFAETSKMVLCCEPPEIFRRAMGEE